MKKSIMSFAIIGMVFLNIQGYAQESVKTIESQAKNIAVVYTFDKENDKRFDEFAKQDLKEIGFFLNDPHHRVNDAYAQMSGSTALDNIGFSSILDEKTLRPLLNKDPRLGGFSPFNLLNYRKKSDMKTVVAHLTPEAILDILEISDVTIREPFIKSFEPLDNLISQKLGGKKSYIPFQKLPQDTMMNFEIPIGEVDDIDEYLEKFQEKFQTAFQKEGFVIAGFYNIKESFNSEEDVMPAFTAFWSYAICHIPFSMHEFDGENGVPIAAIFAPCSMYLYVEKDNKKIVLGMPTLITWSTTLGISDTKKLEKIHELDIKIPEIIRSLGGVDVPNGNPLKR